jgi:ribosomal biogenesis protein LAS1
MSRYTITPWRTHSDLLSVRQQLYSLNTNSTPTQNQNQHQNANPDLRHRAVSRIMAWKLRGNLPHAVESTALLTDAILHHDLSINSIFSVRAVYAAAFTRFVTGFCDIGRNRERALEPSSMLVIARQIDMPDEFVALRHEATHEDLPSVQRLVAVCEQALEWLWRVYWSRLPDEVAVTGADVAKVEVDVQQVREEGGKLLKEYRKARKQLFRTKAQTPMKVQVELINKTVGQVETLCRDQESAIVVLTETLLEEKMLYPSDRGYDYLFLETVLLDFMTDSIQVRRCYERRILHVGWDTPSHLQTTTSLPLYFGDRHAYALEPAKRLLQRSPGSRKRSLAHVAFAHCFLGRVVACASLDWHRCGRRSHDTLLSAPEPMVSRTRELVARSWQRGVRRVMDGPARSQRHRRIDATGCW